MKWTKHLPVASAVMLLALSAAVAQTNTTATQPVRDGKVLVPERPTAIDANVTATSNVRPKRPERPDLPAEVTARIDRFKQDARKYLEQQQALKKQLQGANDEQRAAIRQQINDLRDAWLEKVQELRKEFKDRLPDLREKLAEHGEVLDSIRGSAQDQLREAQQQTRTRRGED